MSYYHINTDVVLSFLFVSVLFSSLTVCAGLSRNHIPENVDIDRSPNQIPIPAIAEDVYTPDWTSLDARPLPDWYDAAKFGIFIHW